MISEIPANISVTAGHYTLDFTCFTCSGRVTYAGEENRPFPADGVMTYTGVLCPHCGVSYTCEITAPQEASG